MKKPFSPKINVARKVLGFWQQNLARVNIYIGFKGESSEFEKFSHFLNLLDFQLLSQQVLAGVVGNFQKINVNNSLRNSATAGFYISKG